MSMSSRKAIVITALISLSSLIFSQFQMLGYSADAKLNISQCEIKDKTLFYEGNFSDMDRLRLWQEKRIILRI